MLRNIKIVFASFSLIFFGYSCHVNKNVKEQRVMNNIVYELSPYKGDSSKTKTCAFRFVLHEKENKGKLAEWYKPVNYNKLLFYVNRQLTADLKIKQSEKEFSPVMIYFEPNVQMTNKLVFLIAFDNVELNDNSTFEFDDNLFSNGTIKFSINNNFNI
jgi:hypothetical protein